MFKFSFGANPGKKSRLIYSQVEVIQWHQKEISKLHIWPLPYTYNHETYILVLNFPTSKQNLFEKTFGDPRNFGGSDATNELLFHINGLNQNFSFSNTKYRQNIALLWEVLRVFLPMFCLYLISLNSLGSSCAGQLGIHFLYF